MVIGDADITYTVDKVIIVTATDPVTNVTREVARRHPPSFRRPLEHAEREGHAVLRMEEGRREMGSPTPLLSTLTTTTIDRQCLRQ